MLAILLSLPLTGKAQLELVYDINQASAPDQSNPAQFIALGSTVLFAATSGDEGRELWKTDGTTGNTVLVKDIWPGNQSSSPTLLGVVGSSALFAANDGVNGVELWKTDGTELGTVLVKDIFPGSEGGNPLAGAIVFNGALYFTAQDYDRNYELWKSNGTEAGTVMVRDLKFNTVNPGSGPAKYFSTGTVLMFTASTDALGTAIYTTDGTSAGTVLVKDLTPGSSSSYMGPTTVMNGVAYFGGGDGTNGNELWRSDGTPAGTFMVKNISPGAGNAAVGEMLGVGTTLYFSAAATSFNNELWKSDGTEAGTVLVKEIRPSTAQFNGSEPFGFKAIGTTVYFFANNGTNGVELWKTDGTEASTVMVKDIFAGTSSGPPGYSPFTPTMVEVIGTILYFVATDGASGLELWKSDGTPGGTVMVKDLATGSAGAGIKDLKAIGTTLYFAAAPSGGGAEPHISDGTAGGTDLLKKISTATAGSMPKDLTPAAGKLFFSANDGVNGRELWVVDDTGAHVTRTLNTNTSDNSIGGLGALNGTAFFGSSTTPGNSDYQFFRSDGTEAGTSLVGQTAPLSGLSSLPGSYLFKAAGNLGFFTADTAALGTELWRTDGTGAGTFLLKDFFPGPDSPELGEISSLGNILYFVGDTDEGGQELWRSDGTAAGTKIVKSIGDGWPGSEPYGLSPLGTTLYFSAYGPGGSELYKTSGTASGTALVKDIADGSSFAAFTTPLNSTTMLFTAFRQAEGTELWKTNGTAAGTVLVKNIRPGSFPNILGTFTGYSSSPFGLVRRGADNTAYGFAVINGVAYFSADDGTHGRELWKTDGTDAGTVMIKDIAPGLGDSNPYAMVVGGDKIYFVVTLSGATQLWTSDGTEAGTVMVEDQVQNLDQLTLSGTDLYMVGSQTAVGTELFRLPNVRPAPFAIALSPLPKNLAPGAPFTLVGAATPIPGAAPLTYLWRRNGLAIPGATQATYSVAKVTESNQGSYDLLVRSGDFELLSAAAQVEIADPAKIAITQQPQPKLALTFTSTSFQVQVIGDAPQFQWYKGVTPILGATAATYTIPTVLTTDAALYKVKVTNSLGSVFSAAVQLAVVSTVDQFVPTKPGTTAVMSVPAVGTGLKFQWLYGSGALANGDFSKRISGVTTSKLSFTKVTASDTYDFACLVTLGGQAVVSGKMKPRAAAVPVITPVVSPPSWIISQPVSRLASTLFTQSNLNLGGTGLNAPTIYSITGLPKGLVYDTKTGLITGRPQVGGGTSVTLTIKVGNIAGTMTSTITVTIPIQNYPALAKGAFRGLVDRSNTTLNDNLGDYVQADITAVGALTGKLFRGTTAYSFTARNVDTFPGLTTATALVTILRPGSTPVYLNLSLDGLTGAMSGTLIDGTNMAPFTCVRSPWVASGVGANPATAYAKAYTATLQLQGAEVGDAIYPQGEPYAVASITNAGAVSGAVRLADGTKVTYSTLLGAAGEVPLYAGAYTSTGSLHGWTLITSATGNWDGTNTFFKAPQPAASTTRSYKGGVPLHTLTLVGGTWIKPVPVPPTLLFGVTDPGTATAPNNAEMLFTHGGIHTSNLAVAGTYDVDLRIKAPASTFVLPPATTNTGKLSLAFGTLATGEITGSFATTDPNPVLSGKTVPRSAPYYGVIVQRLNRGRGHFNLPKLPDAGQTNPLKTEILSGLVEFRPLP